MAVLGAALGEERAQFLALEEVERVTAGSEDEENADQDNGNDHCEEGKKGRREKAKKVKEE